MNWKETIWLEPEERGERQKQELDQKQQWAQEWA